MPSSSLVIDLLNHVQKLSPADFEDFFSKMLTLRKKSSLGELSVQEMAIVQEIDLGLPKDKEIRLGYLIGKRDAATLSEEEYRELLILTEEAEAQDLQRLKLIGQLAELRQLSLAETVEVFNIRPTAYG